MSTKYPGPLVVEGKLSDAERLKKESNFLRGTIKEDLNDGLTVALTAITTCSFAFMACISKMTVIFVLSVPSRS